MTEPKNIDISLPKLRLKGRVLIVEDDAHIGSWLQSKLRALGADVILAHSLKEARAEFLKVGFHAVVTDVFLDGDRPDGLQFVEDIQITGIPVIVMTSRPDLKIVKESMNHGAIYFLEKPFSFEELAKVLQDFWESPRSLQAMVERFLDVHSLTPKEKEVVRLILKGLSNKEVAEIGGNSDRTIKFHLTTIFEKCGVKSRTELFNAIFPN